MLKQVGTSGQIALGKRYAGRLFEMKVHPDERIELVPMRVVISPKDRMPGTQSSAGGWVPPGGYDHGNTWAQANRAALEDYDRRLQAHGTAAEQLQAWVSGEADGA